MFLPLILSSFISLGIIKGTFAFQSLQSRIQRHEMNMVDSRPPYRLWGDDGIPQLGILGKPVGLILNLAGDLLRIQGDYSIYPPEETKRLLFAACEKCRPNGLSATQSMRSDINSLAEILEASNPTRNPADSKLMGGIWRMIYTTATSGGNAGRIGPLTGDVYQDLQPQNGIIKNICKIQFPPLLATLTANQSKLDRNNWRVDFIDLKVKIFGQSIVLTKFPSGIFRIWEITYLDQDLRILRARSPDKTRKESQLFILTRDDKIVL